MINPRCTTLPPLLRVLAEVLLKLLGNQKIARHLKRNVQAAFVTELRWPTSGAGIGVFHCESVIYVNSSDAGPPHTHPRMKPTTAMSTAGC